MRYSLVTTKLWGVFGYVERDDHLICTYLPQSEQRLRRTIRRNWPDAVEHRNALPVFSKEVRDYFNGDGSEFTAKIDLSGVTPFRRRVLEFCRTIPVGETMTYTELGVAIGSPRAARAVGSAMAGNPIPLVIPCHRVLRSDGSLGGFSSPGGLSLKERMLQLEQDKLAGSASRAGNRRKKPRSAQRTKAMAGAC